MTSQITSATTSCSQFSTGTAATISSAQYTVKARTGTLNSVNPSALIYWLRVTAGAGSNHFDISQSITSGNFTGLWGLAKGSNVFNTNCVDRLKPAFAQSPGSGAANSFTVDWTAPAAGTYFIMLKLAAPNVRNLPVPNPSAVHYDFSSANVPNSTSGLDLVNQSGLLAELYPFTMNDQTILFLLFDSEAPGLWNVGRKETDANPLIWSAGLSP